MTQHNTNTATTNHANTGETVLVYLKPIDAQGLASFAQKGLANPQ